MTENLTVVRNVTNAVTIPVIADIDTGYGNAINVMRTVREFEAAERLGGDHRGPGVAEALPDLRRRRRGALDGRGHRQDRGGGRGARAIPTC